MFQQLTNIGYYDIQEIYSELQMEQTWHYEFDVHLFELNDISVCKSLCKLLQINWFHLYVFASLKMGVSVVW